MRDALGLLTTFGRRNGGGALRPEALRWFPVVGALLGVVVGTTWWLADTWWPRPVAAALTLLVDAACTGLLHLDGLADAADGLLPHASRERRLAIMRAPDVGAFGVATLALVVVLESSALASRAASIVLVVALWGATRAFVACVPAVMHYARDTGLVSPLLEGASLAPAIALVPALVLAPLPVLGALCAAAGVLALAQRRLGGFTGDILGAAIVIAQAAGLVVAAAKW
jgi:adenosylcobinamide-GDP ribazoletransferase